MPSIHLSPFSPPRKKLRLPQHPDFPLEGQISLPAFSSNFLSPNNSFGCLPESTLAGIQGARHANYGISLSNLHLNKLHTDLFHVGFPPLDHNSITSPILRVPETPALPKGDTNDNVSCVLSMATSTQSAQKLDDVKAPQLVLFGQTIFTEQQISLSSSADIVSPVSTRNSSSNRNLDKISKCSDGFGSACERFQLYKDYDKENMTSLETGHCKIFVESEDVGRTMDLTMLRSYDELCRKLSDMFGIEKSVVLSHVLYRDRTGAVKHIGDEAFRYKSMSLSLVLKMQFHITNFRA